MSDPGTIELRTPIDRLPGVRRDWVPGFVRLGLTNVGRLIDHMPLRHEREEAEASIADLAADAVVSARGEVTATSGAARFGRARPRFEAVLHDHSGRLDLIWFNQPYMARKISRGMQLRVQGKSKRRGDTLQIVNPRIEIISEDRDEPDARDERLRPVYPTTEGLPVWAIERVVSSVLDDALEQIEDHLPDDLRTERELPPLRNAYRMLHAPRSEQDITEARRRLIYDELLMLQSGLALRRSLVERSTTAPALRWDDKVDQRIRARFPFALTPQQDHALRDVIRDLQRTRPASRLIQGDVGSGKTVVALYAMLMAVASGAQAALLAPTSLLAEQHNATIRGMLRGSDVRIALLTGNLPAEDSERVRARIARGEVDLVIGTHALLGERVRFKSLALNVIDEQHRFGVVQRATMREHGEDATLPHTLVMTATPIPRTLSFTLFGDLDISTIDAPPPGRGITTTERHPLADRERIDARVRALVDAGEQAYYVAPAIEGDDERTGVRQLHDRLAAGAFEGVRLGILHGRLPAESRDAVMERFRSGVIRVLVATTVIEVGVDIPNANIMVVEHADRFGLAQLHQLRGRVGRGDRDAHCFLMGDPATPEGEQRLDAMVKTTDGFEIAEIDFELRGPGELVGERQSGGGMFRLAEFPRDVPLLMMARRDAQAWIERSPTLDEPGDALLKRRMLRAFGEGLGLADVV
ncbi:MAG: ATP-dependent DNA helicase RecG [Planctomycetota bacterium]